MNVTFDLETLGNTSQAPIIQIAAVVFDDDGNIIDLFDKKCNLDTIPKSFQIDGSTLAWWFEQMSKNPKLIDVMRGIYSHSEVMVSFTEWVDNLRETYLSPDEQLAVWSHCTFDPPILNNNLVSVGIKNPFHYREHKDIRTLTFFAPDVVVENNENAHNALDDCFYQARYITECFRFLKLNR